MSMDYIREVYDVPAKRGGRVEYSGCRTARLGTIVRSYGARLCIRLDGDDEAGIYHPTWKLRYLDASPEALPSTKGLAAAHSSSLPHAESIEEASQTEEAKEA